MIGETWYLHKTSFVDELLCLETLSSIKETQGKMQRYWWKFYTHVFLITECEKSNTPLIPDNHPLNIYHMNLSKTLFQHEAMVTSCFRKNYSKYQCNMGSSRIRILTSQANWNLRPKSIKAPDIFKSMIQRSSETKYGKKIEK